ncbi:haloacid dehalogenase superfamily, subfamily IA, variant 3 with third motif having DD or ED [Rhizobium sp. RU20A]|uniref:HAD-IA family hydrolase n=1 Tax=Rhizobium sp. RU20A TaxID=1907412 RepID=UPI00095543C4|nr:HAD-IA family hydrolase [Rhizobium sp. RU20A]SIQ63212.1 haloacid dehalogenase superfamily, subfamily IA, variant 3 with third motif having DD or ED [Rhizobium sp. RU20A]
MQALIFDCDGVLVDTERDGHRVAFNEAFAELGLETVWSVERYGDLLLTAGGKERMRRHFDETGWPESHPDRDALILAIHKLKTEIFMRLIREGRMPLRSGVARIVDEAIANGIKLAVCSTSNEKAVQAVVDVMLGAERSKHITVFAGDAVAAKKPAPDIYNLAAQTLTLTPGQCMVIEDSNNGLRAAKAAGMHCTVTVSSYTGEEDFSLADKVVADLDAGGVDIAACRAMIG